MPFRTGRPGAVGDHEKRPAATSGDVPRAAGSEDLAGPDQLAVSSGTDVGPTSGLKHRSGTSKPEPGRWKSIRPWKPPASVNEDVQSGQTTSPTESSSTPSSAARSPTDTVHEGEDDETLSLEVIDVSSTAIALGIIGLQSQSSEDAGTPAFSICLNQAPWPHVFHSPASDSDDAPNDRETVVVYGLEPGHEYEVELAVVGMRGSAGLPFTTPAASHDTNVDTEAEPEDAPPPYSPSPMSAATGTYTEAVSAEASEAALRAQIKKLRAASKASETHLHSSINALQKVLERAAKEDQRTRQRLIALDDGTRKLKEAASRDHIDADEVLEELPDIERESTERQQQVSARKVEVQAREKEVLEQIRQDEEILASLNRQIEELKDRVEGVRAESERYEQEVIDDLTARLSHLDRQLQSGEISPSFLTGVPSMSQRGTGQQSKSMGTTKGRDRKGSNAALSKVTSKEGKSPQAAAPPHQPRIIPGLKNPNEKHASPHPPAPLANVSPAQMTSAPHAAGYPSAPLGGSAGDKVQQKTGWFGAVGDSWALRASKSNR